ncbi:MAG: hypothetical protein H6816_05290 [Phycisphaerales bacterium]|nr:hypothetical protein [Phycisphaerales bacterium]
MSRQRSEEPVEAQEAQGPTAARGDGKSTGCEAHTGREEKRSRRGPTLKQTQAHRACLKLVGAVLNDALGALNQAPREGDRVGQGAYYCVLCDLFDALRGAVNALPLAKITRVSKIIAEQRRAETASRRVDLAVRLAALAQKGKGAAYDGTLRPVPGYFDEMVRQIYGVGLDAGAAGDGEKLNDE